MKLQVKGKDYKIDTARFDKIMDGLYYFIIEFSEPKYFECMTSTGYEDKEMTYDIDIFPRDKEGMIELTFIPEGEFKPGEEYRLYCEGSRYVIDAIFVRKDLLDRPLNEISVISL